MDARTLYWNTLVVGPFEGGLRFIALDLQLGAALAIVLFTVAVRLVLLPLTARQRRTQRAMAALRPQLEALRARHAKNQERLSRETAALYRSHGIHPVGGLLPLLVQLPVMFGLYAALRDLALHEPVFQAPWLWLTSLQQPDSWMLDGLTLPGPLPVLAAVTQWMQQLLLATPDTADHRPTGWQSLIGPAMMLWFGLSVSAGLALYWVTQNVVGASQRILLDTLHRNHG